MKSKKFLFLLCILPLFAFNAHKYYLSLTQIEYNTKSKSIEIIINVFIDDLETSLTKAYNQKFELDTKKEIKNTDKYFREYLEQHLLFKIDNKKVQYNYIGKEYDGDVVFFYLEIKDIKDVKEISIHNTILIDEFPDQQNLIKSKVYKKHKSVLLTKKKQNATLSY